LSCHSLDMAGLFYDRIHIKKHFVPITVLSWLSVVLFYWDWPDSCVQAHMGFICLVFAFGICRLALEKGNGIQVSDKYGGHLFRGCSGNLSGTVFLFENGSL